MTAMLQLLPAVSVAGQLAPRLNWVIAPMVTVNVTGPMLTVLLLLFFRVTDLLAD